jgi:hypothetical protein
VHRGTEIVPSTIGKGIKELRQRDEGDGEVEERRRVRRPGSGRPSKISKDPQLLVALLSDPLICEYNLFATNSR